jgi:hypothetical protein
MDKEMDARVATLEREMGDVNKTLFKGNGTPPMTARMSALEKTQSVQTWLLRTILGGVIAVIIKQYAG